MSTKETQEQLQDIQDITVKMNERLNAVEGRELKFPEIKDYDGQLLELKGEIAQVYTATTALQTTLTEQKQETGKAVTEMNVLVRSLDSMIKNFPKVVNMRVEHLLKGKQKILVIAGLILLLLISLSFGLNLHLWSANGRLHENDIKYRFIRQTSATITARVDTLFKYSPDSIPQVTEELEQEQRSIAKAEAIANEKKKEADEAKARIKQLKKKVGR